MVAAVSDPAPSSATHRGVATRNASSTLARNIVARAHHRSGTPSRSSYMGLILASLTGRRLDRVGAMSAHDVDILITRLDADLPLPSYAHPWDAGADLLTAVDVRLEPGERALVPTGIAIALPEGYVGLVHPRSGLAARFGVSIVNAPGTVDAGYRGEITVLLVNLDPRQTVHLSRGDRVAQLVVQRVEKARFVEVERLPATARGDGGYGSTGGFAAPADSGVPATPTSKETH